MLIAIMGDAFDELMEQRDVKEFEMKLAILAEQAPALKQKSAQDEENVYMILVEPVADEDFESEGWQGTINELTRITRKELYDQQKRFDKMIRKLGNKMQDDLKTKEKNTKAKIN